MVIFVLGGEAGKKAGLGGRLIEKHGGQPLNGRAQTNIQKRLDEGRGTAVVGGKVGAVSSESALTDPELDVDQASDFGAALINHEIGHALGRPDKRDTSMMDDRIGTTAQPTPPNPTDKKKLNDELKKVQGEVKH